MDYVKAPGERFELSDPCEYVLYGYSFPGTRPTRLGDPGSDFRQISFRCKTDYILRYLVRSNLLPKMCVKSYSDSEYRQ